MLYGHNQRLKKEYRGVKRALSSLVLVVLVLSAADAKTQRRRRSAPKKKPVSTTPYAQKQQAEIQAGRYRIASQIKTLTQFLYLLGSISKGIETAEHANRIHEDSSVAITTEQIERNKSRVKDSIHNVRLGLDQLETSFRINPVLTNYYATLAGVGKIGQTAENQAAANRFEEAGRSLLTAVNKLADALVTLR
jgi:hypothetical protein